MKKILTSILLILSMQGYSQQTVQIASSGGSTSSELTVVSTTKGSIPFPLMTSAQRLALAVLTVGLHVYQTDATEGVYVYKSTGW